MKSAIKIAKSFSRTLYKFNKLFSFGKSFDRKYTVCTKCYSLYDPDKCTVKYRGKNESAKCTFIKLPNHHQEHQRTKQCGKILMRTFVSPSGERCLYPCVIYCYRLIKQS